MRAFWKKVFKNLFLELGRKMWFSEKRQKLLYFDKALWPNHLTYSKPLGISGKTMSISFIWYPGIWNLSSHWVTVALWKWWPSKGSGRKWVIGPCYLARPWLMLYLSEITQGKRWYPQSCIAKSSVAIQLQAATLICVIGLCSKDQHLHGIKSQKSPSSLCNKMCMPNLPG